jgi:protoporphyrinogen/coproporphyrinogen III oxidase
VSTPRRHTPDSFSSIGSTPPVHGHSACGMSPKPHLKTRVAVLGAGPAGLSAAHALLTRDSAVLVDVFEAEPRVGGCVISERVHGLLFEAGPNSMNAKHPAVHDLVFRQLGLAPRVRERSPLAQHFFVAMDGRLVPMPRSIPDFITSTLLSTGAKLRILAEPFIPRIKDPEEAGRESIEQFFTRRFGREVADTVVDPAVAGIFSGRTANLSMKRVFARLWTIERKAGSVVGGMLRGFGKTPPDPRFPVVGSKALRASISFDDGLEVLTTALASGIQANPRARIKTKDPVRDLDRDSSTGLWKVNSRGHRYDAVISTIPAHAVRKVRSNDSAVKQLFLNMARKIVYAPVAVVLLVYKEADIKHKLDGFGFLVPSKHPRNGLLGVTFSSSNYPGRIENPEELYVTAYVGGSRDPGKALLPAAQVTNLAASEVQDLIGTKSPAPVFSRVKLWSHGIPQYTEEFDAVEHQMRNVEILAPGLVMAGNYRDGVGLPDAILSGLQAADRALESIARASAVPVP